MRTKFIDCDTLEVIDSKGRSFLSLHKMKNWYSDILGMCLTEDM